MGPENQRQRSQEHVLPATPQMAARIDANGGDDNATGEVTFRGEAHKLTVISVRHGTGSVRSSWESALARHRRRAGSAPRGDEHVEAAFETDDLDVVAPTALPGVAAYPEADGPGGAIAPAAACLAVLLVADRARGGQ